MGRIREGCQEALFGAIQNGEFPQWRVMVQIMPEAEAEATQTTYDPFDLPRSDHSRIIR